MGLIFCDGFDKYGVTNSNVTATSALLTQEWTSVVGSASIVAGLSATGYALSLPAVNITVSKTLATNYGRIIGGCRISPLTAGTSNQAALTFFDGASAQCCITLNATSLTISVRSGGQTGTALGTSSSGLAVSSVHYLEWDITIGASSAYQIWLDGVSIVSGTGNTRAGSTNNYISVLQLSTGGASPTFTIDDLYLFDTTGSTNNAVLLTSPRIETTFPASDSAAQFSIGAATLGSSIARTSTNYTNVANVLYLRPYTPTRNCTLTSISLLPAATSAAINLRPVVYADNSGTPNGGALLSGGATVTGVTSGTLVTMPLTTPQSLTAGTQYWLGFMADIAVTNFIAGADATAAGRTATSTFTSGAPSTCPTMATSFQTAVVYGNVTSTGANYYEMTQPTQGLQSYVIDSTVNDEDLYNFGALVSSPTTIYAVAIKANCSRSDSGARTVSLRMKSGSTDSGGSLTGQTPGTSFGWLTSLFPTDPNTGSAWLPANLATATCGFKIDA
jgi:hypothetical protein